jgi:hypothetical protein
MNEISSSINSVRVALGMTMLLAACSTSSGTSSGDAGTADSGSRRGDASLAPAGDDASDGVPDAGPTCAPVQLSADPVVGPPHDPQAACSLADLEEYWTACGQQEASPATCNGFKKAHDTCALCIDSSSDDAELGPVVFYDHPSMRVLNVAGCMALIEGTTDHCGGFYQSWQACTYAACAKCPESAAAIASCTQEATNQVCQGEASLFASTCQRHFIDPRAKQAEQTCFGSGQSLHDDFMRVAQVFCLDPGDAGAGDAPTD